MWEFRGGPHWGPTVPDGDWQSDPRKGPPVPIRDRGRRALNTMEKNGFGRIVNISSVEGRHVNKAAVSHYITNKHAINGLTRAIAFEYGPIGITCNAIAPGAIETDIMKVAGRQAAEAMGITYDQFLAGYAEEASIKRLNTFAGVRQSFSLPCTESKPPVRPPTRSKRPASCNDVTTL